MDRWLSLVLQFAIPVLRAVIDAKLNEKLDKLALKDDSHSPSSAKTVQQVMDGDTSSVRPLLARINTDALDSFQTLLEREVRDISSEKSSVSPLELQKEQFRQAKALQQSWLDTQRNTLLEVSERQRETALKLPEVHQILEHWPLRLFPSQLLEIHRTSTRIPLRIILAPPKISIEQFGDVPSNIPALDLQLAQGLREFLSQHYSLHSSTRPTEFLGGAWDSKRSHSESSIKALFGFLASQPTLILESETDGDRLTFRMAYWGLGQPSYYYRTLFTVSCREFLEESVKTRALQWKVTQEKLLNLGKTPEEVERLGGDNCYNLRSIEDAKALERAGIDTRELEFRYRFNTKDFEALYRFLMTCHCLVAGWMADIHHLIGDDVSPLLPTVLPELLGEMGDRQAIETVLDTTIAIYQEVLMLLTLDRPYWQPELMLKLAFGLTALPDKSRAKVQVDRSLRVWLQQRGVPTESIDRDVLETVGGVLATDDEPYLQLLYECFQAIGDDWGTRNTRELLQAIAVLKYQQHTTNFNISRVLTGFPAAVDAVALSPDRDIIYSSCRNENTIEARSLSSSCDRPRHQLNGHSGGVLTFTLSDDGRLLASSDRSKNRSYIRLWDSSSGQLKRTLFGHRKNIYALAIARDNQTLASGSHKIKLWNLQTGEPFRTLFGHKQWVYALAIAPDSRTVVSGSEDATLRVWDVMTAELRYTLTGHRAPVRSLAIDPSGQTLASASDDRTVRLWDLESGQFLYELSDRSHFVQSLTFGPNGQYLISGGRDATVKVWHLARRHVIQTLCGHDGGVTSIALSDDGTTLVSGSEDRTIRIWCDRLAILRTHKT
ncbi:WD40 repeat domain-containing protein [Baaleninema simplex]|uniref:WD40 repeat domain-containing protein n=1 Tax=Baaleninema simplex TaxID=2862350 RepID=UPI000344E32F|nr:WD40 repeat domain-containing protein [Baaleninema simplex]